MPDARRVLIVSYDFPPCLEIGAHACAQISRYLPVYGWEPVVLTIQERYIDNIDRHFDRPFPGHVERTRVLPHPLSLYKRLKAACSANGDGEMRSANPTPDTSPKAPRVLREWILSLLMMPDEFTGWLLPAVKTGRRLIRQRAVNHILSTGPCWTNHLVGLLLSRWTGLPWTVHFRDPWTEERQWKPVSGLSLSIERRLERSVLTHATSIVCVTERHTQRLRLLHPDLPAGKFFTVLNGYDGSEWDELRIPEGAADFRRKTPFTITHAGALYMRRTPLPLLRAIAALSQAGEIDPCALRIEFVGWCDAALRRRILDSAAASGLADSLVLAGPVGRSQVLRKLLTSDLLLLLAEDYTVQIPGKTYEYLRSGRPILAFTLDGALSDLLAKTGGAWVVNPADSAGIQAAVREAYRSWRNGTPTRTPDAFLVPGLDRRILAGRLAEVFAARPVGTTQARWS